MVAAMKTTLALATVTAALGAGIVAGAAAAAPATVKASAGRHVEGRVAAIDRSARTFTVRDAERGPLRVKVTASTRFERTSFSSLRVGHRVDVRAVRSAGAWRATKVGRESGGASHDAGDDHGGHGRDHTAPGTPIRLDWGGDGGEAYVAVLDHGRGIDDDEADRVFDRFYRGRASHDATPGTGLALAIVDALARRWGGRAALTNRPEGGARAELRFPAVAEPAASRAVAP
jgi:Histidine kinase-, DNA gyrase B-, and HSP90-like ATPase/Domain of unknown function (DUF5666)